MPGSPKLKPHPLTPAMQQVITLAAIFVAVQLTGHASFADDQRMDGSREGNAELVKIGIEVLRVDPQKEKQIAGARNWALNLIDQNAGGVKFTDDERARIF